MERATETKDREPWTPGPWLTDHRKGVDIHIVQAGDDFTIATVREYRGAFTLTGAMTARDANARLIAAAPELAAMVDRLLLVIEAYDKQVVGAYGVDVPSDVRDARALLAQVRP